MESELNCAATNDSAAEVAALRRLADHYSSLFLSPIFSDARIAAADGRDVPVHRIVLARCPFFRTEFQSNSATRIDVSVLLPGRPAISYESLVFVLSYVYCAKIDAMPKDVCECADEDCEHLVCRPALEFFADVLYAAFVFKIPELVNVFQRRFLEILEKVDVNDIVVILVVANLCCEAMGCKMLLTRCIEIMRNSNLDMIVLEKSLPNDVVEKIKMSLPNTNNIFDKHMKIYKALDNDDVDLVKLLLKESGITLEDAFGLHYAVAHCPYKIVSRILEDELADVNHKDLRGYTVLHVAAMRKESKIIIDLLNKRAGPFLVTPDGKTAQKICKRLTKSANYDGSKDEKDHSDDQVCITLLEEAERGDPPAAENLSSLVLEQEGLDLQHQLWYLVKRVSFAKMYFPKQATLAMYIAGADVTLELEMSLDFSKTQEEQLFYMRALSRTVVFGKRYFPRCAEYLNKLLDKCYLEPDTSEGKKRRYQEILGELEGLINAYMEDNRSALSSPPASARNIRSKNKKR